MNNEERTQLLHTIATTVNHDEKGEFVQGKMERLEKIKEILEETEYELYEIGLCHLYSKIPLSELSAPITVISSHIDTHRHITKPFSEIKDEKHFCGTYDNSITNAAVLTLMLENRLPDSVVVAFTGNEEYGMKGANDVCEYLRKKGIRANVIVTDVTDRGYKGKNVFSLENCCRSDGWTSRVKDSMNYTGLKWKLEDNYEDDETCAYSRHCFECFSFCIPTKGDMHSNKGLKVRSKTFHQYIEALCIAANVA